MVNEQQNGNGSAKGFTIPGLPTFGCKGCESRKAIMGAGNWQMDAALFLLIALGCFIFWKVKVA